MGSQQPLGSPRAAHGIAMLPQVTAPPSEGSPMGFRNPQGMSREPMGSAECLGSPDPVRPPQPMTLVALGSLSGRCGPNLRSTRGPSWGRSGVDLRSIRGRSVVDVRSMWGRCGDRSGGRFGAQPGPSGVVPGPIWDFDLGPIWDRAVIVSGSISDQNPSGPRLVRSCARPPQMQKCKSSHAGRRPLASGMRFGPCSMSP